MATTNPEFPSPGDRLTEREREVLFLIAEGCSSKELAARLHISFKTAVCHRSHIMSKLGARNAASLVRSAIQMGLIQV
jgi:DNA-binding NarL/FixJ family response regulator